MTNTATDEKIIMGELPRSLGKQEDALAGALLEGVDFERWPVGEKIVEARQPRAIALALIPAHHPHLVNARIGYLWVESMEKRSKIILGKASVANAKLRHYGEVEFLVEFNWEAWKTLHPWQRAALVDHELTHLAFNVNQKTGDEKPITVPHDIEEFGAIVARWGTWKPDLVRFGRAVETGMQLDLFFIPAITEAKLEAVVPEGTTVTMSIVR